MRARLNSSESIGRDGCPRRRRRQGECIAGNAASVARGEPVGYAIGQRSRIQRPPYCVASHRATLAVDSRRSASHALKSATESITPSYTSGGRLRNLWLATSERQDDYTSLEGTLDCAVAIVG